MNFGVNFDNVFYGLLTGASVGEYIKLINIKLHLMFMGPCIILIVE